MPQPASEPLKQPRLKTVKRLFALSRNQCCFPRCFAGLIDPDGVVVGEICHIKAQSSDGPRYDASQSAEDRHGFSNLLLMCSPHHKAIDEKFAHFTVQKLVSIKQKHEVGGPAAEPSDDVGRALLENSGFIGDVQQDASGGGINVVATGSTVVVTNGLSLTDAKQVALDVYRENALALRGIAETVALDRVARVTEDFFEALAAKFPEPPPSLCDPDMQHVVFEAQRHAARSESPDLGAILVGLLVERAAIAKRDLLQLVLGEAVSTAGRLTADQFDALSIIFVLRYTRTLSVKSPEAVAELLERQVSPFLDTASRSAASFQHLEYASCGSIGIGSATLQTIMEKTYGHCFVSEIDRVDVERRLHLTPENEVKLDRIGALRSVGSDRFRTGRYFDVESERLFQSIGLDDTAHQAFRELIQELATQANPMALLTAQYPRLSQLESWWREKPSHFTLTSVGIALAHANLRRLGIEGFDLRVWIN
jgi:hypothetical protein